MKMKVAAVLVGLTMVGASQVQAQALGDTCLLTDVTTFTGGQNAQACWGAEIGNDFPAGEQTILEYLNTYTSSLDWALAGKSDDPSAGPFQSNMDEMSSGLLLLDAPINGLFAISLKGGNSFALYLFNSPAEVNGFNFNTRAVGSDLSHASLWTSDTFTNPSCVGDDCVQVPEPTSLAMVFGGLFGLAAVARRRRRNA